MAVDARPVVVDLEAVTAIDAGGIAALLNRQRAIEAAAGRMFLRLNPMVTWALKRSGTIAAFRLWPAPAAGPAIEVG